MVKKFLPFSFLLASLVLPLLGNEPLSPFEPATVEQKTSSKKKMVDEVLAEFQEGKYNSFLKKVDDEYQAAEKKWQNNTLLEQRKKLSSIVQDYQTDKPDELKKKIASLQHAQDQELLEVALSYPNEKISREVRDMVFFSPDKEEEASLAFIHGLGLKFKGDGTTPVENKLIQIDTEFWLKSLSLEIAKAQSKMDEETFQKRLLVLQLEKIKHMQQACQGDLVDAKIKACVNTASTVLPKIFASRSTRKHLIALGEGKIFPQNPAEEKLKKVMEKYLEQEKTLTEERSSCISEK